MRVTEAERSGRFHGSTAASAMAMIVPPELSPERGGAPPHPPPSAGEMYGDTHYGESSQAQGSGLQCGSPRRSASQPSAASTPNAPGACASLAASIGLEALDTAHLAGALPKDAPDESEEEEGVDTSSHDSRFESSDDGSDDGSESDESLRAAAKRDKKRDRKLALSARAALEAKEREEREAMRREEREAYEAAEMATQRLSREQRRRGGETSQSSDPQSADLAHESGAQQQEERAREKEERAREKVALRQAREELERSEREMLQQMEREKRLNASGGPSPARSPGGKSLVDSLYAGKGGADTVLIESDMNEDLHPDKSEQDALVERQLKLLADWSAEDAKTQRETSTEVGTSAGGASSAHRAPLPADLFNQQSSGVYGHVPPALTPSHVIVPDDVATPASRLDARVPRSPARVPRSPGRPPHSPGRPPLSPGRPPLSPGRVAAPPRSPSRVPPRSPGTLPRSPVRVPPRSPSRVPPPHSPGRAGALARSPGKMATLSSLSPRRLTTPRGFAADASTPARLTTPGSVLTPDDMTPGRIYENAVRNVISQREQLALSGERRHPLSRADRRGGRSGGGCRGRCRIHQMAYSRRTSHRRAP